MNGSFGGDIPSTVEGSEITYQCDDGLTPVGTMTAVCGEDGEWRPNPGDVECRKNDTLSTGITIRHTLVFLYVFELAMPRNIHSKRGRMLHVSYICKVYCIVSVYIPSLSVYIT